ncbi:GDP-mannose 4,6-dehydratase [bacterium]|nr:GDP-mannose 4,6-dehydratase [bacterium]
MKVLITGGAGFIGSNLAKYLLKKDHEILIIDDLSTGQFENIKHMEKHPKFTFVLDSILNYTVLDELVSSVDIVYHLAAAVGVEYIINNPLKSIEVNVQGTENVLKLAHKYKKKVLLASTSEVYGKNEKASLEENDDRILGSTTINRWSYSNNKALDEFLALAYFREKKLPIVIVRLFNTTGPGQVGDYGMVVPRFIKQALLNKPITVYGDGEQTRCFTHVDDVVSALDLLMNCNSCEGEIFNVGNPEEVSMNDLAKRIVKYLKSESKIMHISYEKVMGPNFEDMRRRVPNNDKINKFIGWKPKMNLSHIIKDIVKHYEEDLRF